MNGGGGNHATVGKLMLRLSGIYREPSRVTNDATSLLNSTQGQHLRPDICDLLQNDGSTMRGLRLSGTIQMIYRGNAYHIPIDLHIPPNYAIRPPIIYVRPVSSMMIKQGHKHVGADGMVYMPYLHSWSPRTHNLIDTVSAMSRIFGQDPPVFAKPAAPAPAPMPAAATVRPPPPRYHDVTEEQERIRQMEREAQEANEAVRIAREAERKEDEENRLFAETKERLNDKSKFILEKYTNSSKTEIAGHLEDQILLEKSAAFVNGKTVGAGLSSGGGQMEYLNKRKEELEEEHAKLDSGLEQLESFIVEAESYKKTSKEKDVDDLALPADIHSAQMLVLSAESAAIIDALYFLEKALSENKISLEVHLKAVRRLARRQFLIKAHLLKIGSVKAAEAAKPSW